MQNGVHCTLSRMMGEKRVTMQDVHIHTGLSRNTISNLYHDKATRIDYETLHRLCLFFHCSIADLLVWNMDEENGGILTGRVAK